MKKWYVKELSTLSGLSVRTLHHYNEIGLLNPTGRLANGYRVYSEDDLRKLQKIVAFKFFGFNLSQIKKLIDNQDNIQTCLRAQKSFLIQKIACLEKALEILKKIICGYDPQGPIPWESVIQSIDAYKNAKEIDNTWIQEILTKEEQCQYGKLERALKSSTAGIEKAERFTQGWANLVQEISANILKDPEGPIGIKLGQACMDLVNDLYGKEHANLRNKLFEEGFGAGKYLKENGNMTPEIVQWLEGAVQAYWKDRFNQLIQKIETGKISPEKLLLLWKTAFEDLCGYDTKRQSEVLHKILTQKGLSESSTTWLKKHFS